MAPQVTPKYLECATPAPGAFLCLSQSRRVSLHEHEDPLVHPTAAARTRESNHLRILTMLRGACAVQYMVRQLADLRYQSSTVQVVKYGSGVSTKHTKYCNMSCACPWVRPQVRLGWYCKQAETQMVYAVLAFTCSHALNVLLPCGCGMRFDKTSCNRCSLYRRVRNAPRGMATRSSH